MQYIYLLLNFVLYVRKFHTTNKLKVVSYMGSSIPYIIYGLNAIELDLFPLYILGEGIKNPIKAIFTEL